MLIKTNSFVFISFILTLVHHSLAYLYDQNVRREGICESLAPIEVTNAQNQRVLYFPRPTTSKMTLKFLGKGQFGEVFKGTYLNKEMAVKVTTNNHLNLKETKNLHAVQGIAGVPVLFGCEVDKNTLYTYQQLLHSEMTGETIPLIMQSKPFDEILRLYSEVALTLLLIHERKILHRDIKPANMMTDSADINHIYMIDFGLSGTQQLLLQAGSPLYWSPNIFSPKFVVITKADDVFAMGLTMAEMLYGYSEVFSKQYETCIVKSYPESCQLLVANKISAAFALRKDDYIDRCGETSVLIFYETLMSSITYYESQRVSSHRLYTELFRAQKECQEFIVKKEQHISEALASSDLLHDLLTTSKKIVSEIEESISKQPVNIKIDVHKNVEIPGDDRVLPDIVLNDNGSIIDRNKQGVSKSAGNQKELTKASDPQNPQFVQPKNDIARAGQVVNLEGPQTSRTLNAKSQSNDVHSSPHHTQKFIEKINDKYAPKQDDKVEVIPGLQGMKSGGFNADNHAQWVEPIRQNPKVMSTMTLMKDEFLNFPAFFRQILLMNDLKTLNKIVEIDGNTIKLEFLEDNNERNNRINNNRKTPLRKDLNLQDAKPEIRHKLQEILGIYAQPLAILTQMIAGNNQNQQIRKEVAPINNNTNFAKKPEDFATNKPSEVHSRHQQRNTVVAVERREALNRPKGLTLVRNIQNVRPNKPHERLFTGQIITPMHKPLQHNPPVVNFVTNQPPKGIANEVKVYDLQNRNHARIQRII
jgi:serine/threonine protein kinase